MARVLQLETFDLPGPAGWLPEAAEAEIEELRLAAYEQGYAAGWDDAVSAQNAEVALLRADLGRNLGEMSLAYHDARRHVLGTLEPLLHEMVTKVLPAIAHQTLGQIILEQLRPAAETMSSAPITVTVAPANREAVEKLLTVQTGLPITVREEPMLGEGQAFLKLATSEIRVDLGEVITTIAAAVAAFFHTEKAEEH